MCYKLSYYVYSINFGNSRYNIHGFRTKKGKTDYYLDGDRILKELTFIGKDNDNNLYQSIDYLYDQTGPIGFYYRVTIKENGYEQKLIHYYYVKDGLGNIIAITDWEGNIVTKYEYDVWGKCTVYNNNGIDITNLDSTKKHIGNINPLRFKGHYYDIESGFYMVYINGQTRYYDPENGNRNSLDTTILRVNKAGKQLWRLDANAQYLFHLHYGAGKAMRIHRWIAPLLAYNGLTNFGLVTNDLLDFFFEI